MDKSIGLAFNDLPHAFFRVGHTAEPRRYKKALCCGFTGGALGGNHAVTGVVQFFNTGDLPRHAWVQQHRLAHHDK